MKGVLLLLLAIGTFANPLFLSQVYQGFTSPSVTGESCFENPEKCGQAFGHIVTFLKEMVDRLDMLPTDGNAVQAFLTGLVKGLQNPNANGPSACYSDFSQSVGDFANFFNYVIHFDPSNIDYFGIAQNLCGAEAIFGYNYATDCNFQTLINNVESLTFQLFLDRYLGGMCAVNAGVAAAINCSNDYQACGNGVGTTIRIQLAWNI